MFCFESAVYIDICIDIYGSQTDDGTLFRRCTECHLKESKSHIRLSGRLHVTNLNICFFWCLSLFSLFDDEEGNSQHSV